MPSLVVSSSPDTLWNQTQITNFVKKMPAPKKFSSQADSQAATIDKNALGSIIQLLMTHPEKILATKGALESQMIGARRATSSSDTWDVTTLRRIPDYWWVQWVLDEAGSLQNIALQRVIDVDTDSFYNIIEFSLQLNLATVVPEQCKDKKVCSRTLFKRAELVGHRLHRIHDSVKDGKVDWQKCGSFYFTWDTTGAFVQKVHHRWTKTEVVLEDHVRITRNFTLNETWSDAVALVELAPVRFVLKEFWPPGEGPHQYFVKKLKSPELVSIAQLEAAAYQTEVSACQKQVVKENSTILNEVREKKRCALTSRAREARVLVQTNKKKARKIVLTT